MDTNEHESPNFLIRACSWFGLLLAAVGTAFGQSSQVIYDDSLQNGWQDWSWCTRDLNNSTPVHAGTRSVSVSAGAWEAVSLAHSAFSTVPYSNLVFWAHGGSAGGQRLHIMAQRSSGNPTNYFWAGPLSAGTWQKITVPLSSLGVAGVSDCTGFWIRNYSSSVLPTFYLDDTSLDAAPLPPPPPPGSTIYLEAENGILSGTTVSTAAPGYSGTGYVTGFDATGDAVSWTFSANPGLHRLWIRFRSPSGQKGFDALLNGTGISSMFPQTNSFGMLDAGLVELLSANTCQISGGWNYYEIDRVDFVPAPAPAAPLPISGGLSDPQATFAARSLMADLAADYGRHTWSGQQDPSEATNAFNISGRFPAIVCGDFMDYSPSRIAYGANPGNCTESVIGLEAKGQVLSMSWHWNAPTNLINTPGHEWWRGFYTDSTTFDVAAAMANTNSTEYALLLRDIDAIAAQLKKFSSNSIPVLWRPLHEAEGGWFWWGAQGPEPFKALWRLLFARLSGEHGLHNLIWVLAGADPQWYPGDDVVDIVGVDAYPSDRSDALSPAWESLKSRFDGVKLLALTEFGGVPDIERMHRFGVWWSYFSSWSGQYGPTSMPASTVIRIYQSTEVITLDELNAVPPSFSGLEKLAEGSMRLLGRGPRGAAWRLQAASDLELPPGQWTQVSTGRFAGGVFAFTDTQATNFARRFYRLLKP